MIFYSKYLVNKVLKGETFLERDFLVTFYTTQSQWSWYNNSIPNNRHIDWDLRIWEFCCFDIWIDQNLLTIENGDNGLGIFIRQQSQITMKTEIDDKERNKNSMNHQGRYTQKKLFKKTTLSLPSLNQPPISHSPHSSSLEWLQIHKCLV